VQDIIIKASQIKQLTYCGWWSVFFFYDKAPLHILVEAERLQQILRCQLSLLVLWNSKQE